MYQISRTHLIGYLVEDGITSSVHAKHTFSRTSIMLRFVKLDRNSLLSGRSIFPFFFMDIQKKTVGFLIRSGVVCLFFPCF